MKAAEPPAMPAPPSLMGALMSGFDSITSHILLILFPVALDLLLWLGPHLKMAKPLSVLAGQLEQGLTSVAQVSDPQVLAQTAQLLQSTQNSLRIFGEHFDLLVLLRTYPVGIPSMMSARFPQQVPSGLGALVWQSSSWLQVIALYLTFTVIGLLLGTLYYIGVANVTAGKPLDLFQMLKSWPWASLQVLFLTIVWVVLIAIITIPAFFIIFTLMMGNTTLGNFAILVFGSGMLWMLFPLLLSTHGIFVNQVNGLVSLRQSVRITRMTLPSTGLMFLFIFVISQGLGVVWNIPAENTWLVLIGIAGHGFVTTGLLAASFVYYREADQWMHRMLSYWAQVPQAQSKV